MLILLLMAISINVQAQLVHDTATIPWHVVNDVKVQGPGIRVHHTMIARGHNARDPFDAMMVLFGGYAPGSPDELPLSLDDENRGSNDVWVFNVHSGRWLLLEIFGEPPPPRVMHSAHASTLPGKDHMIVFGGRNQDSIFSDLWLLDLNEKKWYLKYSSTAALPIPRYRHASAMCFNNTLVVFGGTTSLSCNDTSNTCRYSSEQVVLDDVWMAYVSVDLFEWVRIPIAPGTGPGPRMEHSMICLGNVVYLVGGANSTLINSPAIDDGDVIWSLDITQSPVEWKAVSIFFMSETALVNCVYFG